MKLFSFFMRAALVAMLLIAAPYAADAASPADEALAKAVSEKLMDGKNNFDATSVIVTAEDGVVYLRGELTQNQGQGAIKRMENAAMEVPGVKRVDADIDVAGDSAGK